MYKKLKVAAYEVKNNCCLFERLFKVKKDGVSLFGRSFFFLEIFTFLYYANEQSDDVIGGSTKTVQHSIKNISRNIGAVFLKLGTRNVHHKRNRMTPTMLLPWQHSWLQSLSVKNQICNLLKWDRGSSSEHTWFLYCLNSPH